jgi:hypothetical protein
MAPSTPRRTREPITVAEQLPDRNSDGHPVVAGLVALVCVGLVVGLVLGLLTLAGSRVLGLDGGSDDAQGGSNPTMFVPRLQKTHGVDEPQITLGAGPKRADKSPDEPRHKPRKPKPPADKISLSASTTATGAMVPFDLTGVYRTGEGSILTVQRFEAGRWADFPATGSVSNQTFQIPVQTSQAGVNRFRVRDTETGTTSNEVRVKVG